MDDHHHRPHSTEPNLGSDDPNLRRACSLSDLNRPAVTRRILPSPPTNGKIFTLHSIFHNSLLLPTFLFSNSRRINASLHEISCWKYDMDYLHIYVNCKNFQCQEKGQLWNSNPEAVLERECQIVWIVACLEITWHRLQTITLHPTWSLLQPLPKKRSPMEDWPSKLLPDEGHLQVWPNPPLIWELLILLKMKTVLLRRTFRITLPEDEVAVKTGTFSNDLSRFESLFFTIIVSFGCLVGRGC